MIHEAFFPLLIHFDSAKVHSSVKNSQLINDWIRYEMEQVQGDSAPHSTSRRALTILCDTVIKYKDIHQERSPFHSNYFQSQFSFSLGIFILLDAVERHDAKTF